MDGAYRARAVDGASGVFLNFGMGFSSLHVLWVTTFLMPKEVRPPFGDEARIGLLCDVLHRNFLYRFESVLA